MKLDVPLVRQTEYSVDCGLAGIAMILQYYGVDIEIDDIKKDLTTDETGSYAPQLGGYLQSKGFDVQIVTMNPSLFLCSEKGMAQDAVKERLAELHETANDQQQMIIQHFIDFLEAEGEIVVERPSIEMIRSEIKAKRPVCALLSSNVLNGNVPIFNFHFNVIVGVDEKNIVVNDPLWDERGGEHSYLIEDFFYALYASAYGDWDNASLLLVKPKE